MEKSRRKLKAKGLSVKKQLGLGFGILAVVLVFSSLYLLAFSAEPFGQADVRARKVAQEVAGIQEVSEMSIYHGQETYYSVIGRGKSGQDELALIPEKSSEVRVYQLSSGISQEKAKEQAQKNGAQSITRVVAGFYEGRPVWEVKSGKGYYLIDFKSGEFVKKEGL